MAKSKEIFSISDLHVKLEGKEIIRGVSFSINKSEVHVIMGPNGSGKSSLCFAIMGHPKYEIEKGKITFLSKNITNLKPEEKAVRGMFLAFQYPIEIEGVSMEKLLYRALSINGSKKSLTNVKEDLKKYVKKLGLDEGIISRDINVGFSGGEKKRAEIIQMLSLNPKLVILDETDSGLDIDSLRLVASVINSEKKKGKAFLIITHYKRILDYINPDKVHVMINGKIIASGSKKLVHEIEKHGYKRLKLKS